WYIAGGGTQNTLVFTYDADGNLLTASNNAGSYTFSYNGDQVISQTDPNGLTLTLTYDTCGNTTSMVDSQGGHLTQSYQGDQLTTKTDNGVTTSYVYDSTGQLTHAGALAYGWDANGNTTAGGTPVLKNQPASDGIRT